MIDDLVQKTIYESNHCIFTTAINDQLICSKDRNFDFNGIPIRMCIYYPCNRIIELNKSFEIDILNRKRMK